MSFERIDKHTSQVPKSDEKSFDRLTAYLEKGVSPFDDRDLYMARALILWFFLKHKEPEVEFKTSSSDSPLSLIRDLKRNRLSFSEVYKTLLSKAKIQCRIIEGISRSGDYQAGDTDSRKLTATWIAVKISGEWRMVYPRWVVQAVKGVTAKGLVLEDEGKKVNKAEEESVGTLWKDFNDFWFLTDPVIFICKCLPNEPKWQLLPTAKLQNSKVAFLKQPNYTEWAYKYGLRLMRKPSCILFSNNGFCSIELKAESDTCMTELSLSGKLKLLKSKKTFDMEKNPILVQYFPPTSAKRRTYGFNIRFPIEGKYNFAVKAGPRNDHSIRHMVCDFLIVCKERMKDFAPLPIEVGETGWAPGPDAVEAGLTQPTVTEPNIKVVPRSGENTSSLVNEVAEFAFNVEKGVWNLQDYETVLFGNDFLEEADHRILQDNVKVVQDKRQNKLNIKASVPREGEYALVIKTVPKEAKMTPKAVCNYMLTTFDISSDEVKSDDSDYSSDEEFKEVNVQIKKLREEKKRLEEEKNKLLDKIIAQAR